MIESANYLSEWCDYTMRKKLVSIVVPVYNIEKYLEQCVDSIMEQLYTNIEIILVDDGSTDSSGDICDILASRDARIKVVHKNNEGVSIARNVGITISAGEYIVFVDPDDYMEQSLVKAMFDSMEKNNSDLVVCNYNVNYQQTGEITTVDCVSSISNIDELVGNVLCGNGYLWNKIFRRSIIEKYKIEFDKELILLEDELFVLNYIKHCNKISCVADVLYNYRIHGENVTCDNKRLYQKIISDAKGRIKIFETILSFSTCTYNISTAWNNMILSVLGVKRCVFIRKLVLNKNDSQYLFEKYNLYASDKIKKVNWKCKDYFTRLLPDCFFVN